MRPFNIIGYVLLAAAGLLFFFGLYCYLAERIMPDPEGFGLVFTIFCLPPGIIFLIVGLCLIPNKTMFLKLFGVGFLLFSAFYYSKVYLSVQLPPRNDVLYLSTEFINPLFGLILLGLGFKFEQKQHDSK